MIDAIILASDTTIYEIVCVEENHVAGVNSSKGGGCKFFDKGIVKMQIWAW